VELVLRAHDDVFDCVVVGVPDERWGEMVVALVEPTAGRAPDDEDLAAHCRAELAGYKRPKQFVFVESLERSPAGKADYRRLRSVAAEHVQPAAVTKETP
jgi:fatty-acyl-CoA synthase